MKEKTSNTGEQSNILIAVPCFGGMIQWRCAATLVDLDRRMNAAHVLRSFSFIANESLIPRARNRCANLALLGSDTNGKPYSHLFFIDADVSFNADDVASMLRLNKPITVLPYSLKGIDWNNVAES